MLKLNERNAAQSHLCENVLPFPHLRGRGAAPKGSIRAPSRQVPNNVR